MLVQMHRHMRWIMWTIVILVTVTFLFFGMYPSASGGRTVAKVDGYVIGSDDVNRAYQQMAENYRSILKDKFTDDLAKALRSQALQDLIQNRLLVREAERRGFRVGDEELQGYIAQVPAFMNQGRFDQRSYEYALGSINMTPAVFEASQREYLVRQKLVGLIEDGVGDPNDNELSSAYAARNPKAKKGDYEKAEASFRQSYLAEKRREALNAFVKGLMNRATITISGQAMGS